MKSIIQLPIVVLLFICSSLASAWNNFGHEVVAAAAYNHLTTEVKARVAVLLKLNPNYSDWVQGVSEDKQDQVAFIKAATWPDYIKRATGYQNDGEDPKGEAASQNTGYSDKLMHRYWHYVDLPFSPDGTPLIQPKTPNAQTQIAAFRQALADTGAADELKSYDLVWLLHLVGDVHQPLHATSRFTADAPKGDRGGNEVALCAKPCRNELHAYWDDLLGTSSDPTRAMTYASKLPAASKTKAAISDEAKWIKESFQIAKKSVYADPVSTGLGPYELSADYKKAAKAMARSRVELAGERLANLINSELK